MDFSSAVFLCARKSDCVTNSTSHYHNHYELNFLTSGNTRMRIGEMDIEYNSFDFLLIPPGLTHLLYESKYEKFDNYVRWFELKDKKAEEDGKVIIGALTTLEEIRNSALVPAFIRDAAAFDASLQLRNSATIGGNFALRRFDSYMIPALLASEADVVLMCTKGEKHKSAAEYFSRKECRALLLSFSVSTGREGESVRIARSSHAHAAVTGARSEGVYAYAVSSSGIAYGGPDAWKEISFTDDLTGSADYKRYLASVLFKG